MEYMSFSETFRLELLGLIVINTAVCLISELVLVNPIVQLIKCKCMRKDVFLKHQVGIDEK